MTDPKGAYIRLLVLISLTGIVLRVAFALWVPSQPVSDAWSYFQRAINLATKLKYEAIPGRTDASYPPLYSIVLSLSFHLPGDRLIISKMLNCILGGISIFLIGVLARKHFNQTVGIIASIMLAVSPRTILMSDLILSENLFLPLLLLWLLFILDRYDRPISILHTSIVGMMVGVMSLTRTIALALFVVWILPLQTQYKGKYRPIVAHLFLSFIAANIILAPWGIRNQRSLGYYAYSTVAGIDLFIGNNPNATGEWYFWPDDLRKMDPQFDRRSLVEQDRTAGEVAIKWMINNPQATVALYLKKMALMFRDDEFTLQQIVTAKSVTPPYPGQDVLAGDHPLKNNPVVVGRVLNLSLYLILILEVTGLLLWALASKGKFPRSHKWQQDVGILTTAFYFPIVTAVFHGSSRYVWPTIDLLLLYAAFTIWWCHRGVRALKSGLGGGSWPGRSPPGGSQADEMACAREQRAVRGAQAEEASERHGAGVVARSGDRVAMCNSRRRWRASTAACEMS